MNRALGILRAECFSPNSVAKDRAIMAAVAQCMSRRGWQMQLVSEDAPNVRACVPQLIFSMARRPATLQWLSNLNGTRIINRPQGVARCSRAELGRIMRFTGVPVPPESGPYGYWLKRADTAAQTAADVVFAPDEASLQACMAHFRQRGITIYEVSAHVQGDVVKFYGVLGTGFFRCYYPADDGQTKFCGDLSHNSPVRHYAFSHSELHTVAEQLAQAVGIEVYGGDCIVRADGTFCMIDFNDWPSFSRCCSEAAEAIVSLV